MGKDGPCYHCGITSSPLWRNGPPGKPILCNACGSRWRTKGTLVNYTPLHAQLLISPESLEEKLPPLHMATTWHVRRHFEKSMDNGQLHPSYCSYPTNSEGDMSNISSSGSALSALESSGHLGRSDGNDISGPPQETFLDIPIPKKRRSKQCQQSASSMEMFRRDLVKVLHQKEPSLLFKSSEDILIEENLSMYSETGLGAVLLKPSLISKELSEDISHVIDSKVPCLNMGSSCLSIQSQHNEINLTQIDNDKFILDAVDTKKREDNPEMDCAYTNKSL
ncbi:Gata transcription factor 26-like [Thalictrum thalictroides]|uniref:Gata transcription factor 26-like n=1 Tax=Thalictrum thalictroides TaxID=46969 RepID=A0A7J6X9A1_THATH|nr:Gata transcription factor 26-like [Thalictrum thalictroides]